MDELFMAIAALLVGMMRGAIFGFMLCLLLILAHMLYENIRDGILKRKKGKHEKA